MADPESGCVLEMMKFLHQRLSEKDFARAADILGGKATADDPEDAAGAEDDPDWSGSPKPGGGKVGAEDRAIRATAAGPAGFASRFPSAARLRVI